MLKNIILLIGCLFIFSSCTVFSEQLELDPLLQEPTPIEDIDITITIMGFLKGGWECARRSNIPAWLHPMFVHIFGCATTIIIDGKVTECDVILAWDSEFIRNHELNHCLGYID
ncbi:MAG: hypothetical protein KAS39_05250 [Actinomycetia bacterium]|nr:hypothetical protein [Actinomycetes bacterium]